MLQVPVNTMAWVACAVLWLLLPGRAAAQDSTGKTDPGGFLIPAQRGHDNQRLYYTLADVERIIAEYDKRDPPHGSRSRWVRWVTATGVVSRTDNSGTEVLSPAQFTIRLRTHLDWPEHIDRKLEDGSMRRLDQLELMASQTVGEPPQFSVRLHIGGLAISHELGATQLRYDGQAQDLYAAVSRRLQRDELAHGFDQETLRVLRDVPAALRAVLEARDPTDPEVVFDMASFCGRDFRYRAVLLDRKCELTVRTNGSRGPSAGGLCFAEGTGDPIQFQVDVEQARQAYEIMRSIADELPHVRFGLSPIQRQGQ